MGERTPRHSAPPGNSPLWTLAQKLFTPPRAAYVMGEHRGPEGPRLDRRPDSQAPYPY